MRFTRYLSILALMLSALAISPMASARAKYQGFCVTGAGTRSLGCTVRVLLSGTLTQATLYSNNAGALQGNPFTADASTGLFQFYADNGKYDITFSGGSPSITVPYTLSAVLLLDNTTTNQPVTFAGTILPTISVNADIGSAAFLWRTVYANSLSLVGGASIGGPLLPGSDGLGLGSATARWNLFAKNLVFYSNGAAQGTFQHSNTTNRIWSMPDVSGTVPLLNLAQLWPATQTFAAGAVLGGSAFTTLTSSSTAPSITGNIRLATADTVNFRNVTNTGDIKALSIDPASSSILIGNGSQAVDLVGPNIILVDSSGDIFGPTAGVFTLKARGQLGAGFNIIVGGGDATSGNNNGANVVLRPGLHNGSGVDGVVLFDQGGIAQSGAALKHARVTTGSVTNGTRVEVIVNWTGSFINTSYTVVCNVNDTTSGATVQGLVMERTRTISTSQTGVLVSNPTGGALTGSVHCIAMHD